ncbi:formate-dependent nitrite reductase complex subunit NrfG [Marinomonas spartinae]|uniref:Formate-dependent nitrite reductase complex subunit NrfG n=1 Tax=Marinomonas spartinae TaxID=1792290 RepID=A0A1A8TKH2_9GAMM|nr:c-type cytochrome biogenesis protein CcmI [Marinomonas spartinae]SBS26563.1 formate-dependent nitrite reductase complex subunit NrfG [Marinomonas spartinae]SBS32838.1 formate-dependent nitrite reductase complex subunit NrfG [Marinomonas spartinae]
MMTAWLVMAFILVASIVYLFMSVQKGQVRRSDVSSDTFDNVRRHEIQMEEEVGRLSHEESAQLLRDLSSETKRTQEQQRQTDITEPRFTRIVLIAMASFVILGSVGLYQYLGYAKEVVFTERLQAKTVTPQQVESFLAYRSHRYNRPEDWYYEANNYMKQGEFTKAEASYLKTLALLPEESPDRVNVLVAYAQSIFYANGNKSSPKMEKVVHEALALDPNQATALGLQGVAYFSSKDYKKAVIAWQNAVRHNHNIAERNTLLSAIMKAREEGDISYRDIPSVITNAIAIKIEWDPNKVTWHDDDTLLVYARIPGQKVPIAIRKISPQALNKPIILTNLDNLMSTQTLASTKKVDVFVKLSSIHSSDLTKGRVIGIRRALPSNSESIYSIKVSL